MRILELFAGTGSVGNVALRKGWEVVSLDLDPAAQATHTCDILYWDYTQYPRDHFDYVFASPPCTEFSTIMNRRPRKLELADAIVERTLDIIAYFSPSAWWIENPLSGLLKTRAMMQGIPSIVVSYCRYGYQYKKDTIIFTNITYDNPLRCKRLCNSIFNGKHLGLVSKTRCLNQKHSIPPLLLEYLLDGCI